MPLHGSEFGMIGVERVEEFFDDDSVDGIRAGRGIVLFPEGVHEILEYGTVVFGSCIREAGIFCTHVGDPLADSSEDLRYGISPDIVLIPAGALLSDAVGVDDDIVESVMDVGEVRKTRPSSVGCTEGCPLGKLLALGSPGTRDIGRRGGFERSAEVSLEASSGSRVRSLQGLDCG